VGKILHINAGESLSLQYHEQKDETIFVLSGEPSSSTDRSVTPAEPRDACRARPSTSRRTSSVIA
jgi:mannose-6-phosphate isomerase-like protein (cupin superfamily)